MDKLYDLIGQGYAMQRQADPRISIRIRAELVEISSVVNVGAGTGSYEPADLPVVAVEPSQQMISQRLNRSNIVQARAEALPFTDGRFEAAMAVLTIHHWKDRKRGLEECARVSRKRVVIMTWDPDSEGFWLVQDYFPQILELDRSIFPSIEELRAAFGRVTVETIPIPNDCMDGFLGAYWRRPLAYLDAEVRLGMSSFSRISDVESRIEGLRNDLATGAWERRQRHLLDAESLDIGYRLVTGHLL